MKQKNVINTQSESLVNEVFITELNTKKKENRRIY